MHNNLNILLISFVVAVVAVLYFIKKNTSSFIQHYFNDLLHDVFKNKKKSQEINLIILSNKNKILELQALKNNIKTNVDSSFQEEYLKNLKTKFELEKKYKLQQIKYQQNVDEQIKHCAMIDDLFEEIEEEFKKNQFECDVLL